MSKPIIPKRCEKVWRALLLAKWPRVLDLIRATDQSCAGRKLREIRELNPGLVLERTRRGATGSHYKEFEVNLDWGKPQPGQTGMLDLDDIREGVRK